MRWMICLLLAGAAHAETAVPDAAWSQAWLDQAYLPRHQALTQAADALMKSSQDLCIKPDAAHLKQAQQAWLATSLAWRAMDGAPAGPMVLERLGRKIDFRPTRPDDIEAAIASGDQSNAATRGLPALEYLFWNEAALTSLKQPARCKYALELATQIASQTHFLDQPWQIYRTELAAENPFFRQNLFSENINLMLASLTSLGKRMPTADGVKPEQFVEWRSGSSKAQFMAQLNGAALAMTAIHQRLVADNAAQMAKVMQQDLLQATQTCGSLPVNLANSSAKARLACSKAVQQVRHRLQNDVAEKLDLTLGFTEGDGD